MRNSIIRKAMKCLDEEDIKMHPGTLRRFEFLMYSGEREYENSKTVVGIGNVTQCGRGRGNFKNCLEIIVKLEGIPVYPRVRGIRSPSMIPS